MVSLQSSIGSDKSSLTKKNQLYFFFKPKPSNLHNK
jgi:hypothetical protein